MRNTKESLLKSAVVFHRNFLPTGMSNSLLRCAQFAPQDRFQHPSLRSDAEQGGLC